MWQSRERQEESAVLVTVVDVRGSAYRQPGAHMLIRRNGERTGSISGGCLEGELLQKAWWWTEGGQPVLKTFDTALDEDTSFDHGAGCNGTVHVLLERTDTQPLKDTFSFIDSLQKGREKGVVALVIATSGPVAGTWAGQRVFFKLHQGRLIDQSEDQLSSTVYEDAELVMDDRRSRLVRYLIGEQTVDVFFEVVLPALPLLVFGAGDDAIPLTRAAKELGWSATVCDARPVFGKKERFPQADQVILTQPKDLLAGVLLQKDAFAVVMNHSYGVDRTILGELLKAADGPRYIGMLGPRARTKQMLGELGIDVMPGAVYAPVGLDIGADTPEGIAISIVAEIQAVLAGRDGRMLRRRAEALHARQSPVVRMVDQPAATA